MNNRERFNAVMNFQKFDQLPVIHFGYWHELLLKWAEEGHITTQEASAWCDGNEVCRSIGRKLGFDYGFQEFFSVNNTLMPSFERKVVKEFNDGSKHILTTEGVTVLEIPGNLSINAEIEHLLVDRSSYEEHYKWRIQKDPKRLPADLKEQLNSWNNETLRPNKIHLGSMLGDIRNWLGIVNLSYMQLDDPVLLKEIIDTYSNVSYDNTEKLLQAGYRPDMAHYWEDICFNHGPLVSPQFFKDNLQDNYRRMSELLSSYGCNLISVDCDGLIDELLPLWLECGVNVMFPIEIGTWNPDFLKWRHQYGNQLRGIGGLNKHAMSIDKSAVDREIERIKPLVYSGGFIPCPDHRLPPETKWELVQYYTDALRKAFS